MPNWWSLKNQLQGTNSSVVVSEIDCSAGNNMTDGRCRMVKGYPTWLLWDAGNQRYDILNHTADANQHVQYLRALYPS